MHCGKQQCLLCQVMLRQVDHFQNDFELQSTSFAFKGNFLSGSCTSHTNRTSSTNDFYQSTSLEQLLLMLHQAVDVPLLLDRCDHRDFCWRRTCFGSQHGIFPQQHASHQMLRESAISLVPTIHQNIGRTLTIYSLYKVVVHVENELISPGMMVSIVMGFSSLSPQYMFYRSTDSGS